MHTAMNKRKKRSRDSKSLNKDKKLRECGTDPNTSDITTFEDFIENVDILHHLAHYRLNPLKLLIGILPKVSKRCGAAAEQAVAMLVDVYMEPFRRNVTDEAMSAFIQKYNSNIKKLSLSCCSHIALTSGLFFEALKTNSVLQTLNLSNIGITQGAKYLVEALRMNSTLKQLLCAAVRPFPDCRAADTRNVPSLAVSTETASVRRARNTSPRLSRRTRPSKRSRAQPHAFFSTVNSR